MCFGIQECIQQTKTVLLARYFGFVSVPDGLRVRRSRSRSVYMSRTPSVPTRRARRVARGRSSPSRSFCPRSPLSVRRSFPDPPCDGEKVNAKKTVCIETPLYPKEEVGVKETPCVEKTVEKPVQGHWTVIQQQKSG